jgi:hypothetical protein
MGYKTGKSKSLDEITLDDALKYPIWEWALDEEGEEGQDETWQRPIIDTDDVTEDIYNPTITLKLKNNDLFGSAEFDNETQTLSAISIWFDTEWKTLNQSQVSTPIVFVALPKINGVQNVEFLCDNLDTDIAERI